MIIPVGQQGLEQVESIDSESLDEVLASLESDNNV